MASEIFGELFKWGRRLFIIIKGIAILYLSLTFIVRYRRTFKTFNKFEICIFMGVIALDLTLILFEIWHSLNVIYSVFMLNMLMKMVAA
jgi:cytochrome c oxidase assembly factor CtaG